MKALLVLLCLSLSGTAHAEPRYTYEVRAVRPVPPRDAEHPSCGALPRMLRDRHRVVFDEHRVWVNGMRWYLDHLSTPPVEALIWYRKDQAYTYVAMSLWSNDRKIMGYYDVVGRNAARKFCMDRVEVVGERL